VRKLGVTIILSCVVFGGEAEQAPPDRAAKAAAEQRLLTELGQRKSEALATALSNAKRLPPMSALTETQKQALIISRAKQARRVRIQAANIRTQKLLKEQVVKKAAFTETPLEEVNHFINDLAYDRDWNRAGISLLIVPPQAVTKRYLEQIKSERLPDAYTEEWDEALDQEWERARKASGKQTPVTMTATNIPMGRLLERVREKTGYAQTIQAGIVVWYEPGHPPAEFEVADTEAARRSKAALDRILVPEVNFSRQPLGYLPEWMTLCRRERDTDEQYLQKNGPVVQIDYAAARMPFSLQLSRLTASEVYWAVAAASGCRCSIRPDGSLIISRKSEAGREEAQKATKP